MTIEPMSLVEIKSGAGLIAEFAKDLLFEKIVLLITSYFCISTEIRFLNG